MTAVTRWLVLGLAVGAELARADIPNPRRPSSACVGKAAGEACGPGLVCVPHQLRRPVFSDNPIPRWESTEVLLCQAAKAPEQASRLALTSGLLVALSAAVALWLGARKKPGGRLATR